MFYRTTNILQDWLRVVLILLGRRSELRSISDEYSLQNHIVVSSVSPRNYLSTYPRNRQPRSVLALVGTDPEADLQSVLQMRQNRGVWNLWNWSVREEATPTNNKNLFASTPPMLLKEINRRSHKKSVDELIILSQCFRDASKPCRKRRLNSRNAGASTPPSTSIYSEGNLNGAASNPMFPGVLLRMKPKSIWIRCPSRSNRIFPLCRSLTCRRYVTREYPVERLDQHLHKIGGRYTC
jgi:hypothetical protein